MKTASDLKQLKNRITTAYERINSIEPGNVTDLNSPDITYNEVTELAESMYIQPNSYFKNGRKIKICDDGTIESISNITDDISSIFSSSSNNREEIDYTFNINLDALQDITDLATHNNEFIFGNFLLNGSTSEYYSSTPEPEWEQVYDEEEDTWYQAQYALSLCRLTVNVSEKATLNLNGNYSGESNCDYPIIFRPGYTPVLEDFYYYQSNYPFNDRILYSLRPNNPTGCSTFPTTGTYDDYGDYTTICYYDGKLAVPLEPGDNKIYIAFRKDSSISSGSDSFKFKILNVIKGHHPYNIFNI